MRLLNFSARNLFSLGQVDIDLNNRGLVLVTGYSKDEGSANGSGKSSLANKGIIWTLFGVTPGGTRADDVINRHTEGKCYGQVTFEDKNGNSWCVTRSRRPNGLRLCHVDGVDVSKRHERETQELIDKAIGRSVSTFLQTDFFGQGRNINFVSMTPKAQVEVLEEILPIARLSEYADTARDSVSKLRIQYQQTELSLSGAQGALSTVLTHRDTMQRQLVDWKLAVAEQRRDLADRIEKVKGELKLIPDVEERSTDVPKLRLRELAAEKSELDTKLFEATSVRSRWLVREVTFQAERKDIPDLVCPTCKQPVDVSITEALRKDQADIADKVDEAQQAVDMCNVATTHLEGEIRKVELLKSTAQRDIESIQTNNLHAAKREGYITELVQLSKQVEGERVNPFEETYKDAEERATRAGMEVDQLEVKLRKIKEERERVEFWVKAFGKYLKTYLIERACPYLNSRAALHLQGLGNSQLQVSFSTAKLLKTDDLKSEFNVKASSKTGGATFNDLSGGEQQIVAFAVGLALADLAATQFEGGSSFMVLDEPFVCLDARNCENLVTYLSGDVAKSRETVLLISNEDNLKTLIPSRIHVVKENGVSCVERTT